MGTFRQHPFPSALASFDSLRVTIPAPVFTVFLLHLPTPLALQHFYPPVSLTTWLWKSDKQRPLAPLQYGKLPQLQIHCTATKYIVTYACKCKFRKHLNDQEICNSDVAGVPRRRFELDSGVGLASRFEPLGTPFDIIHVLWLL